MPDYSMVQAEQELGLKASFSWNIEGSLHHHKNGALKRRGAVEWRCKHEHLLAREARICAMEQLRVLWFAQQGEQRSRVLPADPGRVTVNLNVAGQRGIDMSSRIRGWDKTSAVNRALSLLADVLEAQEAGVKVKFAQPDGTEDTIMFLG